jgi:hypothetical protein
MARAAAGASTVTNQQLRKARASVDEQISSQRERVTGRVRTLSRALKGAGEMLEEDDLVAQCLHFAGDKVNGVASYVEELEPAKAAEDLRGLARDRPAWFFGGAFALGLALGRFARSSTEAGSRDGERGPTRQRRTANPGSGSVRTAHSTSGAAGRSQAEGSAQGSVSQNNPSGNPTRNGALWP